MSRGLFVVIEGISGSGKGTQVFHAARHLFNKGKYENVLVTREPSDSDAGKKTREQRAADKAAGIHPRQNAQLYAQLYVDDRFEHCRDVVSPALQRGQHVVSDRYAPSTYVVQEYMGVPFSDLAQMHTREGILVPDLTLILDVPAGVSMERIRARGESPSSLENVETLEDLRERYLRLRDRLPNERIRYVNANQAQEHVARQIISHLDEVWAERRK
ncbi:dTMP kinase [Candidatus Woesearchaeota archaeon]|nr:MAG: dTMP kinase [Candidatus Woesearchaeota archaeon]